MKQRTPPQADEAPDATIFFNGVNGATGGYLRPPVALSAVARRVRRLGPDPDADDVLLDPYGLRPDLDASDLAQAGWGVVFPQGMPSGVREGLRDLLAVREQQAGGRYRELEYLPGETKLQFLRRHGVGPGITDPEKVPYYLLLVGDPEAIPFEFQFHLGVQRAVGRLWLDTPDDWKAYAGSVAAAEAGPARRPRTAAFFAPDHPGDELTHLSAETLARPLAEKLRSQQASWEVRAFIGADATRPRLASLLGGDATPSLLFTAGHGIGFTIEDERQLSKQGALLCQEWPGPAVGWSQGLPDEWYFSGEQVPADTSLAGLVCFCFACHSAGTPRVSAFKRLEKGMQPLAARAFVARLPQKLLAAGAHAVIGHVDQSWQTSFLWSGAGAQLTVFESVLWKLTEGCRVGEAMAALGERWVEIAADRQEAVDEADQALLLLANNDARGYVLLGDPAVRVGGL